MTADGDAVDVEHEVGPPLVVAAQGHFLGDGEVVLLRLCPVDELDRLGDLAGLDLHRHAVAQEAVDRLVVFVEAAVRVLGLGLEQVDRAADLLRRILALRQVLREQPLLDVAVAGAVAPVAEVAVAEFVAEQGDHPVLRHAFWFADAVHTSLVLPVSNSCIMACLRARVFSRRCSNAASSASMSDSTSAMAVCSGRVGNGICKSLQIVAR